MKIILLLGILIIGNSGFAKDGINTIETIVDSIRYNHKTGKYSIICSGFAEKLTTNDNSHILDCLEQSIRRSHKVKLKINGFGEVLFCELMN